MLNGGWGRPCLVTESDVPVISPGYQGRSCVRTAPYIHGAHACRSMDTV